MEGKVKLPQDLITCPLAELQAYIDAHLPGGHKRKLAEAVLILRKQVNRTDFANAPAERRRGEAKAFK